MSLTDARTDIDTRRARVDGRITGIAPAVAGGGTYNLVKYAPDIYADFGSTRSAVIGHYNRLCFPTAISN